MKNFEIMAAIFIASAAGCGTQTNQSQTNDLKIMGDYTVYAWPEEMPYRDLNAVATQMREYSNYVGTLLNRQPIDEIESSWENEIRMGQVFDYIIASSRGAEHFCSTIKGSLVDFLLPEGSTYRQLGNCGEGGMVGACLSYNAGFTEEEIRLCHSKNDHFFAMVKDTSPEGEWCLLDRWPFVEDDNFVCSINWDSENKYITHKGEELDINYFEDVECIIMTEFLSRGASVL